MKFAATENPRSRREELGQFLTAPPVADFMARRVGSSNPEQLLIRAVIEKFIPRWTPDAAQIQNATAMTASYSIFQLT